MKIIHFGMGNIGRGFIAPILQKDKNIAAIKFVDINKDFVEQLNMQKKYFVNEITENNNPYLIENVSAVTANKLFNISNDFVIESELITTSIGQNNLQSIKDAVIKIIKIKHQFNQPLVIMCCENGNRISSYFKDMISKEINIKNIFFVDAVVDRIVPSNQSHTLDINVESYYSWIADVLQWPSTIKRISSIQYSNNLDGEIKKKLWLLNSVHCALAWYRYKINKWKTITTVQEALKVKETVTFVNQLTHEIIAILVYKYNFDENVLKIYAKNIFKRFTNHNIIDELERVGRNPVAKLQANERILEPLLLSINNNLKCDKLLETFNNGIHYHFSNLKRQ